MRTCADKAIKTFAWIKIHPLPLLHWLYICFLQYELKDFKARTPTLQHARLLLYPHANTYIF